MRIESILIEFPIFIPIRAISIPRIITVLGEAKDYFPQIQETPAQALTCILQFQVAVRCNDELSGPIPFSLSFHGAAWY